MESPRWSSERVEQYTDPESGDLDLDVLVQAMQQIYNTEITADELREDGITDPNALVEEFTEDAQDEYKAKEEELGSELMRELERFVILQVVDTRWRSHLDDMDYLREVCTCARWPRRTRSSSTRPRGT